MAPRQRRLLDFANIATHKLARLDLSSTRTSYVDGDSGAGLAHALIGVMNQRRSGTKPLGRSQRSISASA